MRKLIDIPKSPISDQQGRIGHSTKHESGAKQVTGHARYVDDIPEHQGLMHAAIGLSAQASGMITTLDLKRVKNTEGVIDVITIDDIPGHKDIAPVFDGDPILVDGQIKFHGQPIFVVLAHTVTQARQAALKASVTIENSPGTQAYLTIEDAKEKANYVRPPYTMKRGEYANNLIASRHRISRKFVVGGQEHMYLEGQVSLALPEEGDRVMVYTSSQHPSEVQKLVAEVLNVKLHKVTVDMRRMGGGFGGKETQAAQWACLAAVLAKRNNCPVKLRLPRMQDMMVTGKRHPFSNSFNLGVDEQGVIQATKIEVAGNCGHSADLSDAIVDRAMFHADNAYYLANCEVEGLRCKLNQVSHTAFRGFGGPQGMLVAEAMMDAIAREVGEDPLTIRKRNLYNDKDRNTTHYGMQVEHNLLPDLIEKLEASSDYWQRRQDIKAFNAQSPIIKKGLALTPVKFGISFTAKHLNQAGALLHVYTDGSIQINHGGTEMGQGLHTKIAQIVANEFGLPIDSIEVTSTRTDKVPNTSPTAASSGTDINGKAAQNACLIVKERLTTFYAEQVEGAVEEVQFKDQHVILGQHKINFTELVQQAYMSRISLSASGFYKTPKIHYNRDAANGRPFFYFANGASVSEVSIDTLTGETKVERVDILHDVGRSINPAIDIGQIEGGFIQGMGWLTTEDLKWDSKGRLISNNPATYKIPAIGDVPEVFNVDLYPRANDEDSIYNSKAVGEPPLMLAMSVWCAIKDAISSLSDYKVDPELDTPATPERIVNAINQFHSHEGFNHEH
jgi:xanthine dehydrogenase large subunit